MSQTRQNKIVTITNDEVYDLATHQARAADSANVVIPVNSQAERDALTKKPGLCVIRLDVGAMPIDRCDGTTWIPSNISTIWAATSSAIGAGAMTSLGAMTLDAANSQNPSFITSPANSQLQVQLAGVYSFHMHVSFSPNTSGWMAIKNQAGTGTYALVNFPAGGEQSISLPNLYLAANAIVQFIITPATAQAAGVSAQIRATKIA